MDALGNHHRRNWLKSTCTHLLGAATMPYCVLRRAAGAEEKTADEGGIAEQPLGVGRISNNRRPMIDLDFADDRGLAQWQVPELVLFGNTDRSTMITGTVPWKHDQASGDWGYDYVVPDRQLRSTLNVNQIDEGWVGSLTLTNLSDGPWSDIVAVVCLFLRAAGPLRDGNWSQTYYRSGGRLLSYANRPRTGGSNPRYQMSLVAGKKQIERTQRHINKWAFTKEPSDDGIIGVVSQGGTTVLTTAWQQAHHLQANLRPTNYCMHSNPWFGEIGAGQSKTLRGCVLVTAGSLEHAWRKTTEVLALV